MSTALTFKEIKRTRSKIAAAPVSTALQTKRLVRARLKQNDEIDQVRLTSQDFMAVALEAAHPFDGEAALAAALATLEAYPAPRTA